MCHVVTEQSRDHAIRQNTKYLGLSTEVMYKYSRPTYKYKTSASHDGSPDPNPEHRPNHPTMQRTLMNDFTSASTHAWLDQVLRFEDEYWSSKCAYLEIGTRVLLKYTFQVPHVY